MASFLLEKIRAIAKLYSNNSTYYLLALLINYDYLEMILDSWKKTGLFEYETKRQFDFNNIFMLPRKKIHIAVFVYLDSKNTSYRVLWLDINLKLKTTQLPGGDRITQLWRNAV